MKLHFFLNMIFCAISKCFYTRLTVEFLLEIAKTAFQKRPCNNIFNAPIKHFDRLKQHNMTQIQ